MSRSFKVRSLAKGTCITLQVCVTGIRPSGICLGCISLKKIQYWILKSKRIQKRILRLFTEQINPRSLGLWCIKGTEESTLGVDSSAPLRDRDPKDLGLICSVKKRKIRFRILSDLRIQSWILLKKCTLS